MAGRGPTSAWTRGYLLAYNTAQALGWCYVLNVALQALLMRGGHATYQSLSTPLRIFQGLSLAETLHVLIGAVRGSCALTFLQWFGRANVLFLILQQTPEVWDLVSVPVMCVAWAAADVVRYAYYVSGLEGATPAWLTWLRYSAFILLYPLGIFCGEMPIIYKALPYLSARRPHSISMPNKWNFAFDYPLFVKVGLYFLIPCAFLKLYTHLLQQRASRLRQGRRHCA